MATPDMLADAALIAIAGGIGLSVWRLVARLTGRGASAATRTWRVVEHLPARLDQIDGQLADGQQRMAAIEAHVCAVDQTMTDHIAAEEEQRQAVTAELADLRRAITDGRPVGRASNLDPDPPPPGRVGWGNR